MLLLLQHSSNSRVSTLHWGQQLSRDILSLPIHKSPLPPGPAIQAQRLLRANELELMLREVVVLPLM